MEHVRSQEHLFILINPPHPLQQIRNMKCFSNIIVATLISLIAGSAALADPAIAINTKNSEQIDSDKITSVLVGKRKFWDNGAEVVIAILKGNPNASKALEKHAKMDEGRFKNHWQRLAFSGRGRMPKFFSSTEEISAFVASNEGAIGVLDGTAAGSDIKILN